MSLQRSTLVHDPPRFPRVSGDEPRPGKRPSVVYLFSPRERG